MHNHNNNSDSEEYLKTGKINGKSSDELVKEGKLIRNSDGTFSPHSKGDIHETMSWTLRLKIEAEDMKIKLDNEQAEKQVNNSKEKIKWII